MCVFSTSFIIVMFVFFYFFLPGGVSQTNAFTPKFPYITPFFFKRLAPGVLVREDLSTGLLLEHMPQLSRRAFVGVDLLSGSSWVKCVKIMQGPMPQAGLVRVVRVRFWGIGRSQKRDSY